MVEPVLYEECHAADVRESPTGRGRFSRKECQERKRKGDERQARVQRLRQSGEVHDLSASRPPLPRECRPVRLSTAMAAETMMKRSVEDLTPSTEASESGPSGVASYSPWIR